MAHFYLTIPALAYGGLLRFDAYRQNNRDDHSKPPADSYGQYCRDCSRCSYHHPDICSPFQGKMAGISSLACLRRAIGVSSLYGVAAIFYTLDQFRFHINESSYVTEVEKSDSSPKFVVFDWGGSEFVGSRTKYFLVFDQNNSIARGLADPMDMPLPNERTKCDTSVLPLHGSFYSVTVNCELT